MKFLKIGNTVFNPEHIIRVRLNVERPGFGDELQVRHEIEMSGWSFEEGSGGTSILWIAADSPEGQAIAAYFDSPNNVLKLTGASEEEEAYGWYQESGGTMVYSDWLHRHRKWQQLLRVEDLSEAQGRIMQRLEEELLH